MQMKTPLIFISSFMTKFKAINHHFNFLLFTMPILLIHQNQKIYVTVLQIGMVDSQLAMMVRVSLPSLELQAI